MERQDRRGGEVYMPTNLGRISGPLLKSTLTRDGVDLQIQNTINDPQPILKVDVDTGRIGIGTGTPVSALDVVGTTNTDFLTVENTITTTDITSPVGSNLTISPGTGGTVQILGFEVSNTAVSFDVDEIVANNLRLAGDGDATTVESLASNTDLFINSAGTGKIITNGIDLLLDEGNTYYVTANGNDLNAGTATNNAFASVRQAVLVAPENSTIKIGAGTFTEITPITLKKGQQIIGSGLRTTQLKPDVSTQNKDFFASNGEVTIEDLTIRDILFNVNGNPEVNIVSESNFTSSVAALDDKVGGSVAIGNNKILVGAKNDGSGIGAAFIYNNDSTNEIILTPSNGTGGDAFGTTVAIADSKCIVAAPNQSTFTGSVYVYELDGTGEVIITASDSAISNYFGYDVAAGLNKVVVGTDVEKVYTFNYDGTGQNIIVPSDSPDGFGKSVAIGENKIVVGAPATSSNTGAVYIYDVDGSNEIKIIASDATVGDFFGASVAIGEEKIVVGAYGETGGAGAVYIYDLDGTNEIKVSNPDPVSNDRFGWDVTTYNERIIVSAYQDTSSTGAVYTIFTNGALPEKIVASDGVTDDDYGFSVAAGDNKLIVGAPGGVNTKAGKVYSYNFQGTGSGYAVCYQPGADIQLRSSYIKNVTILNKGSVTSAADPYGFGSSDAGRGIIVDGSKVASGSIEAAMLFSDVTIFAPASVGLVLKDGARAEWLNSFVYFADFGIIGEAGTKGAFNNGKTKLTLSGISGTFQANDEVTFTSTDGSTVVTVDIESVDGNTLIIDGREDSFEGFDFTPQNILATPSGATATTITAYDRKDFGAELRSISSANVYGNHGVKADGPDVRLRLSSHDFGYIGVGSSIENIDADVITANEVIEANGGKVFYNSTDQYGDFRIGDLFLVDQETGSVSFQGGEFDVQSISGITFTDGGNTTIVDPTQIKTGSITIAGDQIRNDSGNVRITSPLVVEDPMNVTGVATFTNNVQVNGTLNVDGQSSLASVNVEDLTVNRVVYTGTNGELRDTSNLQYNGSILTVTGDTVTTNLDVTTEATLASAIISDLTATRIPVVGTAGAIEDHVDLTYTTGSSTLNVNGQANLASANVSDLTDTRVVYAGTGGELQDSANMVFDGTDLTVASAKISDLTNDRVTFAGLSGALEDSANLTYDGFTLTANDLTFTGSTIAHTGGNTQTIILDANLQINGTTTTVNSTTVTVDDPIITLGGDTAPASNDSKDRGVEFRWHDGATAKDGFFGFDESTGYFTFIPDATNTSEVFSGGAGRIDVGSAQLGNLTSGRIPFASANGLLVDTAELAFNQGNSTLTVDGDLTVTGTFSQSAGASGSSFNSLQIDDLFFDNNTISVTTSGEDLNIDLFNDSLMNVGGGLTVAGNITPVTGRSYDLGTQEKAFRSLYLGTWELQREDGYLPAEQTYQNLNISNLGNGGFVDFDFASAITLPVGDTVARPKVPLATPAVYNVTLSYDAGEGTMSATGDLTSPFNVNVGDVINILNSTGEDLYIKNDDSTGTGGAIVGDPAVINNGATNGNTIIFKPNELTPGLGALFIRMVTTETNSIPLNTSAGTVRGKTGQIRFNTDDVRFEGYNGIDWIGLGGLADVDQDTFISAETSPGADNDELLFVTESITRVKVDSNGLQITTEAGSPATGLVLDGNTISTSIGNLTVAPYNNGQFIVAGDLVVQGTTTTVDSTTVTVADPILELGSGGIADGFDRGLKLTYNDGTIKSAFIGADDSSTVREFIYIPDATDSSNVFSGALGQAAFGSLRVLDLSANGIPYITSAAAGDQDNQLKTDTAFIYDETNLSIGAAQEFTISAINGNMATTGTVNLPFADDSVMFITGSGNLASDANFTWDGAALNISGDISMTGNVVPTVDSDGTTGYDLGAVDKRWRSLYLSGGSLLINDIKIGATPTGEMQVRKSNGGAVNMQMHRIETTESQIGDLEIINGTITGLLTDGDITLQTQGTGVVQVPGDMRVGGTIIVDNIDSDQVVFNVELSAPSARFEDIDIIGNVISTSETNSDLELRAAGSGQIFVTADNVLIDGDGITGGNLTVAGTIDNGVLSIATNTITTLATGDDLNLTAFGEMEVAVPNNDLRVDQTLVANRIRVNNKVEIGSTNDQLLIDAIGNLNDAVIEARFGENLVLNSATGTIEVPVTDVNFGQNLTIAGTNTVTGLSTLGSINVPAIPQTRIVFTDATTGNFTSDETFRMFGTTVNLGSDNIILSAGSGNVDIKGDQTIKGTLDVDTKIFAAEINIENISDQQVPFVDVTGTIQGNRGFTYDEANALLTVPNLSVDQLNFTQNTISTTDTAGDIRLQPNGTGLVIFEGDQAIQVPVGGEVARPSGAQGQIRFNTDQTQFEGYTDQWTPLGGVRDADNDTFILPEVSPGTDEDIITMTIAGTERFSLSATELRTTGVPFKNGTLVITDGTIGSEVNQDVIITSNGVGKVDLQNEVTISGNLDIGNDISDTVTFVGVVDSDILPDQDGLRNLGSADNSWNNLFIDGTASINIANLTSVDINGGNIDDTVIGATNRAAGSFTTLNANDQVTFSGNIASVDSATGTIAVTGGVGISQNLNVGQNSVFTGTTTVNSTFSATSNVNINGAAAAISIQPTGVGTVTIRPGTVGAMDDMAIGANSASTGAFTTLTSNAATTFTQGTESTTSTSGTLQVTGGIGATGNINIDGSLGVATDATITGDVQIDGAFTVDPVNNNISMQPSGTGTITIVPAVVGSIDRMNIGAVNRGSAAFTTLTSSGLTTITDTTSSTLTTNGALVVDGGVGIAENLNVGGNISANEVTFTGGINLSPANANVTISPTGTGAVTIAPVGGLTINPTAIGNIDNVDIGSNVPGDAVFNDVTIQGVTNITDTTQSNNPDQGALIVQGGVGVYKNLHVGEYAEIDAGILVRGIAGTNSDFYTNIRTDDKILTIGGVTPPAAATSEDRGVEFRWHDGANDKTGFFGYQDSTGYFVFKPDGTNTGDVYTGDTGTINATFLGALTSSDVTITGGNIDGTVIGATTEADANVVNLVANGDVTLGEDNTKLLSINAEINTHVIPATDNTYDLGATNNSWKDLFLGGTLDANTVNALNVDIDGGAIDNTTIGATTPNTGAFTTLTANDAVTFTAGTSSTTTLTGTAVITGGIGVSENINAGGSGTFVGLESTGSVTFDPANAAISLQPTGLGSVTIAPGTTGTVDNMNVGSVTRGSGAFTTLQANDQVTFNAGVNSTAANNGTVVVAGGVGVSQDLFVGGNGTFTGNLTVNGTTTTVNSTTITVDDVILTLGGDTAPVAPDNKDRGIEFRYYGTALEPSKLGFMGWNNSSGKFTMLLDVSNNSEVVTGDIATLQANLEGNILAQSATINAGFINGTEIGTTTPDVGIFTDLTSNGNTVIGDANLDTLTINAYISSSLIPSGGGLDIGSATNEWNDIYIDGTAFIDSLEADTVDIDAGTIDNITLGTNSPVTEAQIDNVNIDGNTISASNTDGEIIIEPDGVGTVIIQSNQAMKIPLGTDAERPAGTAGQIRFNTSNEKFEGYIGTVWTTLGGVRDADGDTFIAPELTPGSNDDTIFFYVGGVEVATLDATSGFVLNVGTITAAAFDITDTTLSTTTSNADLLLSPNGTGSVQVTSTNASSAPTNGALQVKGGLGVVQNVQIGNDLIVQGSTTLGDDNSADNVVINSDLEVNMQDNAFGTFVIQNVNAGDSSLDKYIDIDTLNGNEKITFGTAPKIDIQNTTTSISSTSGALKVAGGVGIAENLNVGGNLFVTGNLTTDDSMIKLNSSAVDQNDDIGFYGKYNDGVIRYRGLFSDSSSDKKFRLFKDTIEEPGADVNITATGYTIGTLIANIEGGTISNLTAGISVQNGGTGVQSFTSKGILYGNGTDAIQASPRAGTQDQTQSAQLLTVDGTGSPVWTETIDGGTF